MLYALVAILLNVGLKELELSLISINGVAQVILIDGFFRVTNERADGLNA